MNAFVPLPSRGSASLVIAIASLSLAAISTDAHADHCEYDIVSTSTPANYDIVIVGPYAFIPTGPQFEIRDISDPANPTLVAEWDGPSGFTTVDVEGDYAYVAGLASDLFIFDVHQPEFLTEVGSLSISLGSGRELEVENGIVYIAGAWTGLRIIDATDPTDPHEIASIDTPLANGIDVIGTTAYVCDGSLGLLIYDVTDPTAPLLLGTYDGVNSPWHADIVGNIAYVAGGDGLHVVDISDPTSPTLIGFTATDTAAYGPEYANGLVYVAADTAVQIIDVMDPANPFVLDAIPTSDVSLDLTYQDGHLFAPAHLGLDIFDVRLCGDPFILEHPQSTVATPSEERSFSVIAVGSHLAYQWLLNGEPLPEGGSFTGTQTPTLTVTVALAAEGYYECLVANDTGEALSDRAVLAVIPACPEDLDGSTVVGFGDLLQLLSAWGACP